jgi:hypothetical protein
MAAYEMADGGDTLMRWEMHAYERQAYEIAEGRGTPMGEARI